MIDFIAMFIFFFAVIDPIGTVPEAQTWGMMAAVLLVALMLMPAATRIHRLIGEGGGASSAGSRG